MIHYASLLGWPRGDVLLCGETIPLARAWFADDISLIRLGVPNISVLDAIP